MHLTFQADDPNVRHSVLSEVGRRWGAATRLVLQEFVANAAEHCSDHRVDLEVHPGGMVALDYGGGYKMCRTRKPEGEGGYGLQLIRGFGGAVSAWDRGMKLEYRFSRPCDPGKLRRPLRTRMSRKPVASGAVRRPE